MSAGCDGAAGAGCVGLSADIRGHLPGLPGPPLPGPAAAGHQTLHRLAALDQKGALFLSQVPLFYFFYKTLEFSYDEQCCGAGRSRNFWLEPEPMKIRWLRAIFSQIKRKLGTNTLFKN